MTIKRWLASLLIVSALLITATHLESFQGSTASSVTAVADSATVVTLLAVNRGRKMVTIYNDSTVALYVKMGATATTTSYTVQIGAGQYWEIPSPSYLGIITGIWASDPGTGAARITEY